jgi:hypothetical protein
MFDSLFAVVTGGVQYRVCLWHASKGSNEKVVGPASGGETCEVDLVPVSAKDFAAFIITEFGVIPPYCSGVVGVIPRSSLLVP